TGHESTPGVYALDVTLSNFRIEQTSATSALLLLDATANSVASPDIFTTSSNVRFADIDLSAANDDSTAGTVAFTNAGATMRTEGVPAMGGFYPAGTALDALSFSWPVEAVTIPEPEPLAPALSVS